MKKTRGTTVILSNKAEKLAEKWNVVFMKKFWKGKEQFYVHGHFSTISETKLKAINKYLEICNYHLKKEKCKHIKSKLLEESCYRGLVEIKVCCNCNEWIKVKIVR